MGSGARHRPALRVAPCLAALWALVLLAPAATAAVAEEFVCGNTEPSVPVVKQVQSEVANHRANNRVAFTTVTIPVYYHVIAQGSDPIYDGNIYDSQIAQQISILNGVYGPIGFNFRLAGTTRTLNKDWFSNMAANSAQESAAQSALHTGGLTTLNIYTARLTSSTPGSTILGYAYSPWDVLNNPVHDGVFINDRTMPGGTATSASYTFNLGIVTVHEVGHWLGLLHVFAGGCDSSTGGDFVEDTRAAAAADYSCTPTNTCPNLSGTNPIHNFMDYTDDVCRTGFSDGQIARIQSMWQLYRASSASVAGGASGSGTSQGQSSLDAPEAGRAAPATGSATPTAAPTAITLQLPSKAATPAPKAATKKTMAKPTKKPTNKPTKKATAKSSAKVRAVPTRRPTNRKQSQQRLFLPVG